MSNRMGRARLAAGLTAIGLMAACVAAGQQQTITGSWLTEDIGGRGVVDRAQSTIEFDGEGGVYGSSGCNRFNGPVTIDGRTVQFGLLIATRRACPPALMDQEEKFLVALYSVRSYRFDGPFLYGRRGRRRVAEIHPARLTGAAVWRRAACLAGSPFARPCHSGRDYCGGPSGS